MKQDHTNIAPRIIIKGFFQGNNLGDNAILESMLYSIRTKFPRAKIYVITCFPKVLEKKYDRFAIKCIRQRNLISVVKMLIKNDILIIGGGGLLPFDNPIKLLKFFYIAIFAKLFLKKVIIYSIGIDPIRYSFSRVILKIILGLCADIISVRDEESRYQLKNCNIKKSIFIYSDPVFILPNTQISLKKQTDKIIPYPYIAVSIAKPWDITKEPDKEIRYKRFVAECSHMFKNILMEFPDLNLVFIPFLCPDDKEISQDIIALIDNISKTKVIDVYGDPQIARAIIKDASIVFGMRYHSVIFSILSQTPIVAISYGPKIESLMKKCGLIEFSFRFGTSKDQFYKEETDINFDAVYVKLKEAYINSVLIKNVLKRAANQLISNAKPIAEIIREIIL